MAVPAIGGEAMNEALNVFLRSKKILQMERRLVVQPEGGSFWSFCIHYVEDYSPINKNRERVDYKEVLDEATFRRFSRFRELRKQIADAEKIPPYAVFTDSELAEIAQMETLTIEIMKNVKGVGEKKVEKYGDRFIQASKDEKSESPA